MRANNIRTWNNDLKTNSSSSASDYKTVGFVREPELPELAHCALFPRRIIRLQLEAEPTSSRRHERKPDRSSGTHQASIIGQCAPVWPRSNPSPDCLQNALKL